MKSDVRIFPDRVQITRVFDAPRPLVFSYWAQPDKLSLWSSCKDATSVEVEGDFRVGGTFRHKMTRLAPFAKCAKDEAPSPLLGPARSKPGPCPHASRVRSSAVRTLVRDCEDNPAASSTIVRQSGTED